MESSSSGDRKGRPRQNRSRSGQSRNRNRDGNRESNRGRSRNRDGQSSRRRSREPEDDIMQERFARPQPKPTLWQRICAWFSGGAEKKTKPTESKPGSKAPRRKETAGESSKEARERAPRKPREKRPVEKVEVTSGRLYVGNLDYGATSEDLAKVFSAVGTVVKADIVTNTRTGKSKGFAFVEMSSVEEARMAVEKLLDTDFMGRKLLVSGAKSEGETTGGDEDEERGGRPRRERRKQREGDDSGESGAVGSRERAPRSERGGGRGRQRGGGNEFGDAAPSKPKAPVEIVEGTKLAIGNLSDEVTSQDLTEGIEDISDLVAISPVTAGVAVVEFASNEGAQRALNVLDGKTFMGNLITARGAKDGDPADLAPVSPRAEKPSIPAPPSPVVEETTPEAPAETAAAEPAAETGETPSTEPSATADDANKPAEP